MTTTTRQDRTFGYTGPLPPDAFNMARYVIGEAASRTPDKTALVVTHTVDGEPAEVWSYAELERACLTAGAALSGLGLQRGDRILIQLPNTSLYATVYFGAIAAGFVPIPASEQLTEREVTGLLADSGARLLLAAHAPTHDVGPAVMVVDPATITRAIEAATPAPYADTRADDPAYLVYTSGTTSRPKGVLHAHRAAWGRRPMYDGWYGMRADDRMMHAGAFNWTYTLGTGLTDPWANGATAIIYLGEKRPEYWPKLIARHGATLFAAVPSLYRQILKYAADDLHLLGCLRHGLIAGETPPPDLLDHWRAATGRDLYEALGMSEVSTYVSSAPGVPPRPGYAGKPQPGRSVAILPVDGGETPLPPGEEGLLAVHRSDPALMIGYWNRPEEEAEVMRGDWFIGGDLAVMDADGYVSHRGRANDVIKALGYRVSPMEIEAALADCPGVAEIACAEVAVRADVHVIGAFIVPRDPSDPPAEAALMAHAERTLARYKQPRLYRILSALPRTANGKVMRRALAAISEAAPPAR